VEIVAKNVSLESLFVEDVMSSELLVVQEDRGIWDSLQFMRTKGVRRIVVGNPAGGLVGIVSVDDLLELLSGELLDLVKIMTREREKEKESRQ
jgi:predicted transcriptional regulator